MLWLLQGYYADPSLVLGQLPLLSGACSAPLVALSFRLRVAGLVFSAVGGLPESLLLVLDIPVLAAVPSSLVVSSCGRWTSCLVERPCCWSHLASWSFMLSWRWMRYLPLSHVVAAVLVVVRR